jgi:hypothetical protein
MRIRLCDAGDHRLGGRDIKPGQIQIAAFGGVSILHILTAARAAGIQIIWFQNGWDADYVEAGDAGSPNFQADPPAHNPSCLSTAACRAVPGVCAWFSAHSICENWPLPGQQASRLSGFRTAGMRITSKLAMPVHPIFTNRTSPAST